MPKIKPFSGIHPHPEIAGKVPLQLENLSLDGARSIRSSNPFSYINMLVPKLDNPYLRGSKVELVYKKINENFEEFLERGILMKDKQPSIYVYQIFHNDLIQIGIWTLTSIDNYLDNTVKKHEHTREERERDLADYIRQTGIDANPVLITYPADSTINDLMHVVMKEAPLIEFESKGEHHKLWKISDKRNVNKVINSFAKLKVTYIADGHHRAAAACLYGIQKRKLNLKHTGQEEYNYFSSVYMAFDQLKIYEFNRLVKALDFDEGSFINQVNKYFNIEQSPENIPVKPQRNHIFGMYLNRKWYSLEVLGNFIDSTNPVSTLDASILQDKILAPFFGITEPRSDPRISFLGGKLAIGELTELVDNGEFTAAFTLFPTSINELVQVADSGEVMPPKSTWFEPKFKAGLLIHKME